MATSEVDLDATIDIASIDFLARGGDHYNWGDAEFTSLGVSYQQALANFIETNLNGLISMSDYPVEGLGRITAVPEPIAMLYVTVGGLFMLKRKNGLQR